MLWQEESCGKKKAVALRWPRGSLMLFLKIFSTTGFDSDKQRMQPFFQGQQKGQGTNLGRHLTTDDTSNSSGNRGEGEYGHIVCPLYPRDSQSIKLS